MTPPPGVKEAIRKTVAFALDFILDTLDYSPDTLSLPGDEAYLRLQPSADPMLKDQYCVVLWNDDKHSFDEVAQILAELLDKPLAETKAIARRLDENGREIIEMGSNAGRLVEIAQALHHIDLGVTIRRAYDTFCEQVVGVMVEWLLDLTRARMGTDTLVIRECIAQELLAPRRRDAFTKHLTPPCALILEGEVPNAARMDTLLLYHTRLWRRPRLSLKEIYASVISVSRAHKLVIGSSFVFFIILIDELEQRVTLPISTTASSMLIFWSTEKRKLPSNILPYNSLPSRLSLATSHGTTALWSVSWLSSPPSSPTV